MPQIAVFDTNVLISGVGWKGTPFECLELARAGTVSALSCQEILDELVDKLEVRLRFAPQQISETLADLLSCLRSISTTGQRGNSASKVIGQRHSEPDSTRMWKPRSLSQASSNASRPGPGGTVTPCGRGQ